MKEFYVKLIFIFFCIQVSAQVTDVVTGLSSTGRLFLDNNDLYYSHYNTISKIDVTQASPSPTVFLSNVLDVTGMVRKGDFLYFGLYSQDKIVKVDLNDTDLNLIDVTSTGSKANMLAFDNDILYYSDNVGGAIYKLDLNSGTDEATMFLSGYPGVLGLSIKNGYLFFCETFAGKVHKIDLSDPSAQPIEVFSNMLHPLGIGFHGDDLYVADQAVGVIIKIHPFENPVTYDVPPYNFNFPKDIEFVNDVMYIMESDKISKIDLTLSVPESAVPKLLKLYPNPASDFILVSNARSGFDYRIFDVQGRLLINGYSELHHQIDTSSLKQGNYFLHIAEGNVLKFIKQ